MTAAVSAVEAGRIRDAARVAWLGGVITIVTFFVSFLIEATVVGFAAWPVSFAILAVAVVPLLRPAGLGPALVVTLIGVLGAVFEVIGVVAPPVLGTTFRISPIYGAGLICIGAWWVGMGALAKAGDTLPAAVTSKGLRTGLGLALVGASWFIEDLLISLAMLAAGIILTNGIAPLFKYLRSFGLAMPPAALPGPLVEPAEQPSA